MAEPTTCSEESCGAPAVVTVNGERACAEHIDDAMGRALAPAAWMLHRLQDPPPK